MINLDAPAGFAPEVERRITELAEITAFNRQYNLLLLDVVIPDLPPRINDMYATVNGRRVKSASARAFVRTVEAAILTAYQERPEIPKDKPLKFRLECYYPTYMPNGNKSGQLKLNDSDGRLKAGKDATFAALGLKDNNVYQDSTLKAHGTPGLLKEYPGGYCRVTINLIEQN